MAGFETGTPAILSVARASAQGYILLPRLEQVIMPGAGFSTKLASSTSSNPFITSPGPFDLDMLQSSKLTYRCADSCNGTYVSASTTSSSHSSDHLSMTLGIGLGNAVLSASVTGSYDKAVLEDKSSSKISRRTSVQCGAVHLQRPPPLSAEALQLLNSSEHGFEAFCERYGDFYVSGFIIGADAGVLVSQALSRRESSEKLRAKVDVQFLCFSAEKVMEKDVEGLAEEVELNLFAFDSMDNSLVRLPGNAGKLRLQEAGELTREYSARIEGMAEAVMRAVGKMSDIQEEEKTLSWHNLGQVLLSRFVSRLVLMPMSTHREVAPHVKRA
ncbi:hypothetical protein A1O7_02420 [Cladophialophora yegresii CBS 114405]|uniref:Uncharacterized protein n=1 Tax=Cladophialophora yegresii CBS 114405 TaxID=1182544 RepID=W9W216_9EURO|nr:uncharacterized protein A1O7_02420 [Cladophialophora yegresii CBS 114405]EXJ61988.1 hypothetical protein A1O7_02420 [Cladophialophora yegresii CBS 114405]